MQQLSPNIPEFCDYEMCICKRVYKLACVLYIGITVALTSPTSAPETLIPCKVCGRTFVADSVLKHQEICKRVFERKHRPFNSFKQRAKGIPLTAQSSAAKPIERKSTWRQAHEDFINCIRAAKEVSKAMREGRPLPPPPPPSINPDYIQCPFCQRRFNQIAGERHINFCKEQAARQAMCTKSAPGSSAKHATTTQCKKPSANPCNEASKPVRQQSCALGKGGIGGSPEFCAQKLLKPHVPEVKSVPLDYSNIQIQEADAGLPDTASHGWN
ncbi:zinc finger C2HC domain-containing protein 1B [Microcaecilia unicolor]|uniref:Zinc finger C2HC domain-containing protein 1B n=1 Tax=Microcaecilia unicolor TaxID=1415580 RepID=A0A6P7X5T8_9AMPH|nr:zinc finger C2HC domain-containing protein 1B [Microcaecilia unicolor]